MHAVRVCSGCSWVEHHQILLALSGRLAGWCEANTLLGPGRTGPCGSFRVAHPLVGGVGVMGVCGWFVCLLAGPSHGLLRWWGCVGG